MFLISGPSFQPPFLCICIVVHAWNPRRLRQEDLHKLEDSLVYVVNSRTARAKVRCSGVKKKNSRNNSVNSKLLLSSSFSQGWTQKVGDWSLPTFRLCSLEHLLPNCTTFPFQHEVSHRQYSQTGENDCVPIKLYWQKQALVQLWPIACVAITRVLWCLLGQSFWESLAF